MMLRPRGLRAATLWAVAVIVLALVATGTVPAYAATPIDTIIDSAPPSSTPSTSATFTFHSTRPGATFACRLDSARFVACTSPKTYAGLAARAHTFSVRSTASRTTDRSPAARAWTVDPSAPTAPTKLSASASAPTSVVLSWVPGTDNIAVTGNDVYRDGARLATLGAVTSFTDSTVLAGATHSYTVVARDAAGNASAPSAPVSVTTPLAGSGPDTVIDSGPAAATPSTSATFAFHSAVPGATFACSRDGAAPVSCTSPTTYTGLVQGTHAFSVAATVGGGTDSTPAAATWVVDTAAPSAPTGLADAASATSVGLTWAPSVDVNGVTGYDVYRDGTLLVGAVTGTTYTDTAVTLGGLYSYSVLARDAAGNVSARSSTVSAQVRYPYDANLTRSPYLTDLVGRHVAVNFATLQSATNGSIRYGAVDGSGGCAPTTTVAADRITIQVGTVAQYQWTAQVDLPAAGTYCYRAYLGATDLLNGNPSPKFTSQVPLGGTSGFTFDVLGDWGQVDATGGRDQANLLAQVAKSGARFAVTVGDNGYPNGSQVDYGDLQHPADTSAIFGPGYWGVPGATIPIFTAAGNHGLAGVQHTDITTWTQARAVATSGGRYQNDVYCCLNGTFSANYGSEWYAFDVGNARFYILDSAWGDTNGGHGGSLRQRRAGPLRPGHPGVRLAAQRPADPCPAAEVRLLPLSAVLGQPLSALRHLPAGGGEPRGAPRPARRPDAVQRARAHLPAQHAPARSACRSPTSPAGAEARPSRSGRA